jgi:penicillin-binding protein 1A
VILGGLTAAVFLVMLLASLAGARVMATTASLLPMDTDPPANLEFGSLDQRSTIYAADGSVLARLGAPESRDPVPLDEVSEHAVNAILVAEDRRFFEHGGYDPGGILRAAFANVRAGGVEQGGSTITQQLAKLNFVGGEQTIVRKAKELTTAAALEDRYSKEELLERYVNQVYFGAQAYGLQAAAEEYFRVPAADLAPEQAALLAGIIRAPSALEPRGNPDGAKLRRDAVLEGMAEEGFLDPAEAERLIATPLEIAEPLERQGHDPDDAPYVVEFVRRTLLADERLGEDEAERENRLLAGGLEIHTTVNPGVQELAQQVVAEQTADLGGPVAAIASVEPGTGRILALYGGADFSETQFDLATQGRRQPGSAYKPFVLAAALEAGVPLSQPLEGNSPAYFEDVVGWDRENDGVRNFEDADLGTLDLRQALVRSSNTAFAELMLLTGQDAVMDLTDRLGIAREAAYAEGDGPAIALGGLGNGVTPLEMAAAYATFAAGGTYAEPWVVERVLDRDGAEVLVAEAAGEQVLTPEANAAMVDMMTEVVTSGTGTGAQVPGWDVAGKTGTTQNSADAWFVGTAPVMSTAVWVGHAEGQVAMPGMTGGSVPATIWQSFMAQILGNVDPIPFPDADVDFSSLDGEPLDRPDVQAEATEEPEPTEAPEPAEPAEPVEPAPAPAPTEEPEVELPEVEAPAPQPTEEPEPEPEPEPAPDDDGGGDGGGARQDQSTSTTEPPSPPEP